MRTSRHRLTLLAAGIAVVALSGSTGAVAAGLIDSGDIKNDSVRSVDIQNDTLRSNDIQDGTIRPKDLRERLRALITEGGEPGPQGEPGPAGPAGPAGPSANVDALEARVAALEDKVALMQIDANCDFDFPAQKMWEIVWGYSFENRDGGATIFDASSYGGLETINGNPETLTAQDPNWRWLYVTGPVNDRVITYGFADGTEIVATVSEGANGCPVITWEGIPVA